MLTLDFIKKVFPIRMYISKENILEFIKEIIMNFLVFIALLEIFLLCNIIDIILSPLEIIAIINYLIKKGKKHEL